MKMTAAAVIKTFGFTRRGPWLNSLDNNFTGNDSGHESSKAEFFVEKLKQFMVVSATLQ